ncbi:MAG: LemA family protein [Lentisphaeria bacterium]|nr:LemA family protein [Lentisphaeria bacterium]
MANPLDEVTGPINDDGREVRVIDKQLPVTAGFGAVLFEIFVWVAGIAIGGVVIFAMHKDLGPIGSVIVGLCAFLPGTIYAIMKVQARNYFLQLLQIIQKQASTIGNYQEQRYQILKNMAGAVKTAVNLDTDVMTAVAAYRGGVAPDAALGEQDAVINRGFAALMPHIENYPQLQAHEGIQEFMRQNSYLQREITAARDLYNEKVLIWNTEIYSWPLKNAVAAKMHLTTKIPFSISKESLEGSKSTFL